MEETNEGFVYDLSKEDVEVLICISWLLVFGNSGLSTSSLFYAQIFPILTDFI